jgi:dynein heavy chain
MNKPKFVFEDVPLFMGLINDLFPGLEVPRVANAQLEAAVRQDLAEHGFEHSRTAAFDLQVDKVVQLYETQLTRHTVMVVGPTQGGKTVVIETLARARLAAFNSATKLHKLNPKAQNLNELYGVMDPLTRDWTDGILSKLFRQCNLPLNKANANTVNWIVFDGDVDALWVENMNSVMDDNKLLTLPNGERILLQDHCKILVEVADLQYASPATVSRCGMVFVDPKNLGYFPYFDRWARDRGVSCGEEAEVLNELLVKYMQPCVDFVLAGLVDDDAAVGGGGKLTLMVPQTEGNFARQLCSMYTAVMRLDAAVEGVDAGDKEAVKRHAADLLALRCDAAVVESVFVFCLVWSVGGCLDSESRARFDAFLKQLSQRPMMDQANKGGLPKPESLFDYQFVLSGRLPCQWVPWSRHVAKYEAPVPFKFSRIIVPTVDTVRNRFLIAGSTRIGAPALFVGASGTAKTITCASFLNDQTSGGGDEETSSSTAALTINFSSRTTAADVQRILEDNVEKRGPVWAPPGGKRLLVFVDDLNMPVVDTYGTQQPIALLLLLINERKMFERGGDLDVMQVGFMWLLCVVVVGGGHVMRIWSSRS